MGRTPRKLTTTATVRGYRLAFQWSGGPYVDVYWDRASGTPFEVVNVYDYQKGENVIPFERRALHNHCKAWALDIADELDCYWENTGYY